MSKQKSNVVLFKDSYRKEYIRSRARKYYLPEDLIKDLLICQEIHGLDITTKSGRTYMDDCISVNAIRWHL